MINGLILRVLQTISEYLKSHFNLYTQKDLEEIEPERYYFYQV